MWSGGDGWMMAGMVAGMHDGCMMDGRHDGVVVLLVS